MERFTPVDFRRLFDAADALLKAMESDQGMQTQILMSIDEGNAEGTAFPGCFSRTELIEAMTMLIRMGYVKSEAQHI